MRVCGACHGVMLASLSIRWLKAEQSGLDGQSATLAGVTWVFGFAAFLYGMQSPINVVCILVCGRFPGCWSNCQAENHAVKIIFGYAQF